MKKLFLMLSMALLSVSALAQEDNFSKWEFRVETGPGRSLTPFHHMKGSNGDDILDDIWTFEVSVHHKLNQNFLLGIGTGMWGKVGGAANDVVSMQHTNLLPLFGELTLRAKDEKSVKPFLILKAGPAFSVKDGPNFGVFGAQGGVAIKLSKTVDFNLGLDINRAIIFSGDYENFRCQTYAGAKAGFTIRLGKGRSHVPQIIERETIYRDVPREVEKVREIERVVEVTKNDFTPVPIFFQLDKVDIQPRELVRIQYVAQMMKANPDLKFIVNGYADEVTGTVKRNEWLAEHRAENVYKALLKEGVPASQITSKVGHGGVGNMFLDNNVLSRCVVIEIVK